MIPTEKDAKALWDKYLLPEEKRVHMTAVAKVALAIADGLTKQGVTIDAKLLLASALLHDIDKAILKLPGEKHPDSAVRLLREERMEEVAMVVKTHSLHAILDSTTAPVSLEQKVLYLADKMVKYELVGVDKRFTLWKAEDLPTDARVILDTSYPFVKKLEAELLQMASITMDELAIKSP